MPQQPQGTTHTDPEPVVTASPRGAGRPAWCPRSHADSREGGDPWSRGDSLGGDDLPFASMHVAAHTCQSRAAADPKETQAISRMSRHLERTLDTRSLPP